VSHFVEQIEQAISQATSQYYRLVIIAGLPGSGKTAALQQIASRLSSAVVNVNRELSQRMLEMTRSQRSRQVERLLREVIAGIPGDIILLDNMEILFDPELEVEPLRLLQLSSRNRTLVATWSGSFMDGILTYAEPGHPEFQQFKQPDAVIISTTSQFNS
jgi:Cdc6-like AAA superfamily ATPase